MGKNKINDKTRKLRMLSARKPSLFLVLYFDILNLSSEKYKGKEEIFVAWGGSYKTIRIILFSRAG